MKNEAQGNEMVPKWYKHSIIVCVILMFIATVWVFIGLENGSIAFENELLPGNMFVYTGWMVYLFGAFALFGFVWGIIFAIKGLTNKDIKSVEISAKGVRETSDGCLAQLAGALISPLLFALFAYALSYYAVFLVLEFCSKFFPYIVCAVLLVLLAFYAIFVWNRAGELKPRAIITIQAVALAIYIVLAIFLSRGVDVPGVVADGTGKIVESVKPKEVTAETFNLTPKGVGSLQLGKPFSDMSDSEEGLYNRVEISSFEDPCSETGKAHDYHLYWNDELVASFCLSKKGNALDRIYFYSSRITISNGLHLGMPVCEAIRKGVKVFASTDMLGESQCGIVLTMKMDYIYFDIAKELSQEHFTTSGWQRTQKEIDFDDYNSIELSFDDIAPDITLHSLSIQM